MFCILLKSDGVTGLISKRPNGISYHLEMKNMRIFSYISNLFLSELNVLD